LSFKINNLVLNSSISFQNSDSIIFICDAINSRPKVNIHIVDYYRNIPIPLVPSRVGNQNPFEFCGSNEVCSVRLQANLTTGFAFINNITRIVCKAENKTIPFNLSTSIDLPLNFSSIFSSFI